MVDLLKLIKDKPVSFPRDISHNLKDVIKKMLVVDSKKRINWNDLFSHPINTELDHKLRKEIHLELVED